MKEKFDSLIFDMDGTLWDAVDSYCEIWNVTSRELGIDRLVTREELIDLMGLTIDVIISRLFEGWEIDMEHYLQKLTENEHLLMPRLGGKLYPDVFRLIPELSRQYPLYMASNCGADGLKNFLRFTRLEPYFRDTITFGETGKDKPYNIRLLAERNNLGNPLYVGDTAGDCRSAHMAGVKMLNVTYGFGYAPDADYYADSFLQLTDMLLHHNPLVIWQKEDYELRLDRIQTAMTVEGAEWGIVADNANLFYLTGRVFCGYALIPAKGRPWYFVRRPVGLQGEKIRYIRKPEEIPAMSSVTPSSLALETDTATWSEIQRLRKLFPEAEMRNMSKIMMTARSVKTPAEVELMKECGRLQTEVYAMIPSVMKEGMTDVELQIEIESMLRRKGCLGNFRIHGNSMELFMANILVGDNGDTPSPYDFAMGGAGQHPSLPVGADGSVIHKGEPVMVDANGNFNGYMTDMTRMYAIGPVPEKAERALRCSQRICAELSAMAVPGAEAKKLFERAVEIAREEGLEHYFMGHTQHAGFVGHGVGIEINELPVIAPRSRDILRAGNTIAIEPKFVIPGIGAVGVENTYVVRDSGSAERITCASENL
ncbi:MAG: HAD-IA family hydrolase [Muribaculaceae bacterium]|nr:HAD-IA family hydrolase [Muribaculaceae bacterium]